MIEDGHPYGLAAEAPPKTNQPSILLEAEALVNGDRAKQYGPIREDYARVVAIFRELTGLALTAEQGVAFMVAVKLSRIGQEMQGRAPHKRDNFVDLGGYASKLNDMVEGSE